MAWREVDLVPTHKGPAFGCEFAEPQMGRKAASQTLRYQAWSTGEWLTIALQSTRSQSPWASWRFTRGVWVERYEVYAFCIGVETTTTFSIAVLIADFMLCAKL